MYRRQFLSRGLSMAGACFMPSLALPRTRSGNLLFPNAYVLWYNSPHVMPLNNGFCLGYITESGDVSIAQVANDLAVIGRTTIFGFAGASDHGSPALLRIPLGPHSGKLLACFSNHASELFCVRSAFPDSAEKWDAVRSVDEGRCTYASLAALPDGRILLIHTLQENSGKFSAGEWRRTVVRVTEDGGDSWSAPRTVIAFGMGTFPYCAPLSISPTGRCALVYSVYSSRSKSHAGLTLVVSDHAFEKAEERAIVPRDSSFGNIVPYQAHWRGSGELFVTYSVSEEGSKDVMCNVTRIAFDSVGLTSQMNTTSLGKSWTHTYPTGVCLMPDCSAAIYCPSDGGLVQQHLNGRYRRRILTSGRFASPHVFDCGVNTFLSVLDNPLIRSTRRFSANIRIVRVT